MKQYDSEKILSKFAERLKELMDYREIKSEQLGEEVGLSGETIRRYCKGKSGINLPALIKLADYFACSIDFFAGRSDKILDFSLYPAIPFPQRFRDVIKEKGYTRYSLDKQTKFKDAYISNWDKGQNPNIITLIELADLLDCTIDYLAGRER